MLFRWSIFICLVFLCKERAVDAFVASATFTTDPTPIGPYTNNVQGIVTSCYNSVSDQVVFAWSSNGGANGVPYYAIYDVKSKTLNTPVAISPYTAGTGFSVFCCYNSVLNQVVFSWADFLNNGAQWYAIYDVSNGTFTTPPAQIQTGSSSTNSPDVFCCYNSVSNLVIFTWSDASSNPWYAIYNPQNNTWDSHHIDSSYSSGVQGDVLACYNKINNQVVFSWADNTSSYNPWYAVYDFNVGAVTIGPTLLSPGYSAQVFQDVACCYNTAINQVFFSWADGSQNIWYSMYNVPTNTLSIAPTKIGGYSQGVVSDVFCSYNSRSNEVTLSWAGTFGGWFAAYDPQRNRIVIPPSEIGTYGYNERLNFNLYTSYVTSANETVFSWAKYLNEGPWYAIYKESFTKSQAQLLLDKINGMKNSGFSTRYKYQKRVN